MRVAFLGAGQVSVETARALIDKGHEVIIIDSSKERIDELSEHLDCSFLHGDGSRPDILKEVNPPETDILFCITNSDQSNVIASLVGRSLGISRVVTSIIDSQFEDICLELGLKNTIIPSRTMSLYLTDMVDGKESIDISTVMKDEARFFTFVAGKEEAGPVSELELPKDARLICFYRDEVFNLPGENTKLAEEDEVVILTHARNLPELEERWPPETYRKNQQEESEGEGDESEEGKRKGEKGNGD